MIDDWEWKWKKRWMARCLSCFIKTILKSLFCYDSFLLNWIDYVKEEPCLTKQFCRWTLQMFNNKKILNFLFYLGDNNFFLSAKLSRLINNSNDLISYFLKNFLVKTKRKFASSWKKKIKNWHQWFGDNQRFG